MTAINIVQRSGEILVMSDGRGSDMQGGAPRSITKMAILPHIPLLVAVRGFSGVAHLIVTRFATEGLGGFDAFLEFLPGFAREIVSLICTHHRTPDFPHELYAVGFSEMRGRLESHFLATSDAYASRGRGAYSLHKEDEPMVASPQPSEEAITAARFVCPTVKKFDATDHGVKLMDAQRRTYPDMIGGFVQLARVTREGISSRVIHRWPDEIGKRLAV
jgi:hypothetical protein